MEETSQTQSTEQTQAQLEANQQFAEVNKSEIRSRLMGTASWFYWIAGLSMVNTFMIVFNANTAFSVGLGMTQVVDAAILELFGSYNALGWIINILINGMFVFFGVMLTKGHKWALILGMGIYALDALIFLMASSWFPLAFHAFVLFRLFQGFSTLRELTASR